MKITLSLAQIRAEVGNPAANLAKAAEWIAEAARRGSDLILFPEMWTTSFDWEKNKQLASQQTATIEAVAKLAHQHKIWINGSMLAMNEANQPTNTSLLFNPKGEQVGLYRKAHLFSYVEEDKHLTSGEHLTTVDTPWGKSGLAVCYDIRFPEQFRAYALRGAIITFMPIAFPHPRLHHWRTLFRARAIENQMFMVATNHVGTLQREDTEDITFFGHSAIVDPWGKTVIEAGEDSEILLTATIDTALVATIRQQMHVFADRRPDLY